MLQKLKSSCKSEKIRYNSSCGCRTSITTFAGIAQLVEHFTRNEGVVGSNPISSFFFI